MTGNKQTIKLPFWATFFTILGVIILCSLGTWQIHRLTWKETVLQTLENEYANPTDLNQALIDNRIQSDYLYGWIIGKPLIDKAFFYGYALKDETPGHYLVIPVQTGLSVWIAHLGWTSQDLETIKASLKEQKLDNIKLTGIARQPTWNALTPQNQPEKDLWYRLDLEEIKQTNKFEMLSSSVLYTEISEPRLPDNLPNNTRWEPNNNHAQYALFWFALAATLIIIYGLRFIKVQKN